MQNTDILVKQIEKELYKLDYDDLSDYLKGVRDFINLIKEYEDSESITEYILEQIANNKIMLSFKFIIYSYFFYSTSIRFSNI